MIHQVRHLPQIGPQHHHVGRFDRHVRRVAAERDADRGGQQRLAVVDAVADHGDRTVTRRQLPDGRHLALRQQLRADIRHAHLLRDVAGGRGVVAGEQGRLQPQGVQLRYALRRLGPHLVGDGDERPDVVARAAGDDGLTRTLQVEQLLPERVAPGLLPRVARAADPEAPAVHDRLGAAPLHGPEILHRFRLDAAPARVAHDGAGQRMLAAHLDRQQPRQHVGLGPAAERPDFPDVRLAAGDDAGLVQRDGAQARQPLQVGAALDQRTLPRRGRDGGRNGHRRRDHERARAGHQQDEHPLVEPVLPTRARDERRQERHGGGHGEHQRRVVQREAVDEALGRRAVVVALADHADDARERRIRGGPRRPQLDHPVAVHGPGEYGVARTFPRGHRLARDERLVDVGAAAGHLAVAGDALARPHAHVRADGHLVNGRAVLVVAVHHRRGRRGDAQQRADGVAGPAGAPVLDQTGEPVEERQHAGLRPFLQEDRADHRHQHQRVHVGTQAPQRGERLGNGVEEAGDDGDDEQRQDGIIDPVLAVVVRQHQRGEPAAGRRHVQRESAQQGQTARCHERAAAVAVPPRLGGRGRLLQRLGAHPEARNRPGHLLGTERVDVGVHRHPAFHDVKRHAVDAVAAVQLAPDERRLFRTVQPCYAVFPLLADGSALAPGQNRPVSSSYAMAHGRPVG